MVKLIQHNQNHCGAAFNLMWQTAREREVDLFIVADPVKNQRHNNNIVYSEDQLAAIVTCGNLPIQKIVNKASRGMLAVEVGGILIVSAYAPPSWTVQEFEELLDNIVLTVSGSSKFVVAGDFNAWSSSWANTLGARGESQRLRGDTLLAAFAGLEMVLMNNGQDTFVTPERKSAIDLTFVSQSLMETTGWEVLPDYMNSDHIGILITIGKEQTPSPRDNAKKGWKTTLYHKELFAAALDRILHEMRVDTPDDLVKALDKACDATMSRLKKTCRWRGVYWWTSVIADLRRKSKAASRVAQRAYDTPEFPDKRREYKLARNALKREIKRTKKATWYRLVNMSDIILFGEVYVILKRMVGGNRVPKELDPEKLNTIIDELFPSHPVTDWPTHQPTTSQENPESVTDEEIRNIGRSLKSRKVPGPDGIPNAALATAMIEEPTIFKKVYQRCLDTGVFPDNWKKQRLVLSIPKPGKRPGESGSSRPICLIDGVAKGLERVILHRLNNHIERVQGLSENQYGFRKGRATTDAIEKVLSIASASRARNRGANRFCAVVTLDVKNAFNSASWTAIARSLQRINIPKYLYDIIGNYFRNRVLLYETNEGNRERVVTAGVPQGSVLGPTLWNLMYNEVLGLTLYDGASLIGFADDIVLVAVGSRIDDLENTIETSINIIRQWMESVELQLNISKTEYILVSSHRSRQESQIIVEGHTIRSSRHLKYLGIMIDDRLEYTQHIKYVAERAVTNTNALVRMMPNRSGPRSSRRRIIANTIIAGIRYASSIWAESLKFECRKQWLRRCHRPLVNRVISAFRSTSHDAACVIAGMMPLHILIDEDYRVRQRSITTGVSSKLARIAERPYSVEAWQREWSTTTSGSWTRRLIPNIQPWITRRHGNIEFHMSQFLSGHGFFRSHLHRMGYVPSPVCPACGDENQTAEHTIFICGMYLLTRLRLEQDLQADFDVENAINIMCSDEVTWNRVAEYVHEVMENQYNLQCSYRGNSDRELQNQEAASQETSPERAGISMNEDN
uniref:Reverse transcriptase n=1 Tax=Anopheles gambiae TaxID=7165 RepID=Q868R6_ANOGA|nr:reverse transcriptase [Anopheles gambiae]